MESVKNPSLVKLRADLSKRRTDLKMSIGYVAAKTGIHASDIYEMEQSGNGTVEALFRLIRFYGLEMKLIQKHFKTK